MADPIAEQLLDAVKAVFVAMSGSYAPDKVVQAPAFHGGILDPSINVIYSLSPGEHEEERASFGTTNNIWTELSIGVALCKRFKDTDPEQRWNEQEELLRAAMDAIRDDRTLSGAGLDLTVEDIDKDARDTYVEGWAVVFVRVMVRYLHSETVA